MVVQHNMLALNSNRMLGLTNTKLSRATEKLSSGYRINRSADDAAGLAISEKMRRQVRGLTRASVNCQDGISLVQTAEGALNEIHDMLHRGTELSVQAANDTNTQKDREYIQSEINHLVEEIDKIREKTTFNERNVLKGGELDCSNYRTVREDKIFLMGNELPDVVTSPAIDAGYMNDSYTSGGSRFPAGTIDFTGINEDNAKDLIGTGFNIDCSTCSNKYTFKFVEGSSSSTQTSGDNFIYSIGIEGITSGTDLVNRIIGEATATPSGHFTTLENDSGKLVMHDNRPWTGASDSKLEYYQRQSKVLSGEAYSLDDLDAMEAYDILIQAGTENDDAQTIPIRLPIIDIHIMGLDDIDVSENGDYSYTAGKYDEATGQWSDLHSVNGTANGAGDAIDKFKKAAEYVSRERSRMGAYQNRLEHTINNLDNVVENTTAAESRIRDTDMAREMVRFSTSNILAQAGQTMLAQANQSQNGILSLLG